MDATAARPSRIGESGHREVFRCWRFLGRQVASIGRAHNDDGTNPCPNEGHFRGVREYTNDRSLSDAEIDVILRWVDAGAPKGDDEHMPPLPTLSDGWQLGEPDIVLAMNEAYQIEAEGDDEYRCFVLDPQFETDQ